MFSNRDDGYGGGGFEMSGFGNDDTPQQDKKGFTRPERIVPVTVRQVLESPDTGLKLDKTDWDIQIIKLVGIIRKITKSSLKVTYALQDNTGTIEGIHWLEADADEDFVVPVVENTYCVMTGVIRNSTAQHTDKHIMIFKIKPISDLNEVTAHTLQIIYISLKAEVFAQQPPPTTIVKPEFTSSFGGMDNSMGGGSDYPTSLNPQQQKVLRAVCQAGQSDIGASIQEVMAALTVRMPIKEVEKIIEYLACEGHIYSTSDDKHFRATDAY